MTRLDKLKLYKNMLVLLKEEQEKYIENESLNNTNEKQKVKALVKTRYGEPYKVA